MRRQARLLTAAIVSSVAVAPMAILEVRALAKLGLDFPWVLFGFLWLLPFACVLVAPLALPPRARAVRVGAGVLLILLAVAWTQVVVDQMPCFVGIPNCD